MWWDRKIPPGKTFDETIEEALDQAKAVVAVWTKAGVTSRWVRTEAAEGAARGILVPVLMEDVRLPLAFRRIQVADLTGWEPGRDHAGFTELINALNVLIGTEPVEAPPPEPEDPVERAVLTARVRATDKDWEGVIALLGPLAADTPSFSAVYPDAAELLALSRRKWEALELYEEAEVLYADGRWNDVVGRFGRILELDPDLEYGTDLKKKAERHLASEQEQRLGSDYERATQALDAREWPVAVARYEQLLAHSADYRDAAEQLERARAGAASERHYRELSEQLREGRWDAVIAGMADLAAANPDFGDPDGLFERAEAQRDRAESQQSEAAERTTAGGGAVAAATVEPVVPPAGAPANARTGTSATAETLSGEPPDSSKGETETLGAPVTPSATDTSATPFRRFLAKWPLAIAAITALVILVVVAVIVVDGGGEGTPTTTASEASAEVPTSAAASQGAAAPGAGGLICVVTDATFGTIDGGGFYAVGVGGGAACGGRAWRRGEAARVPARGRSRARHRFVRRSGLRPDRDRRVLARRCHPVSRREEPRRELCHPGLRLRGAAGQPAWPRLRPQRSRVPCRLRGGRHDGDGQGSDLWWDEHS